MADTLRPEIMAFARRVQSWIDKRFPNEEDYLNDSPEDLMEVIEMQIQEEESPKEKAIAIAGYAFLMDRVSDK